jgi:hypothetical protein
MSIAWLAGAIPPHDCINMDASDAGVCGVWHSQKKFFAIQWNDHEKECIRRFKEKSDSAVSINYRERLGTYFSVVLYVYRVEKSAWEGCPCSDDYRQHVGRSMDGTRNTKHPEAQGALRIMSLIEATSHVFTSAEQIPGEKNV